MSTKGIVDLLHGSREIKEFRSKIGVFSRTQKLRSELTRDSGGFGTSLDGLEPRQRVTQPPRNMPPLAIYMPYRTCGANTACQLSTL